MTMQIGKSREELLTQYIELAETAIEGLEGLRDTFQRWLESGEAVSAEGFDNALGFLEKVNPEVWMSSDIDEFGDVVTNGEWRGHDNFLIMVQVV